MRKLVIALIAALALAPAARAAEFKLATVDFNGAGLDTDEGKAIAASLSKEMEEKQAQLDAKQKELRALQEDFEKQISLLNDQAKKDKVLEIQKRDEEVRTMYVQLQQELARREGEASRGMTDRLKVVVKEVADSSGITVVIDRSAVVYAASASLDLTSEVTRKYNARFPYKGGAKPGGKPAGGAKPAGAKPK